MFIEEFILNLARQIEYFDLILYSLPFYRVILAKPLLSKTV